MEILSILQYVKDVPAGAAAILVSVVMLISYFVKRKEIDIASVTSISKLQTEQLATLIEQNSKLAAELHAVRQELTEAYSVINDMRNRITELEETLKKQGVESHEYKYRDSFTD